MAAKTQGLAFGGPFGVAGADEMGGVNRGVIEHQDGGAIQGLARVVDGQHKQVGREGAGPHARLQGLLWGISLPVAQHGVPAATAHGWQIERGLAPKLPGVGHGGLARERHSST